MPTSFFERQQKTKYPVTYLFLEVFAGLAQQSDESNSADLISKTLKLLGVKPPYSEELLLQIAVDMTGIRDKRESAGKGSSKPSGRTPGSDMMHWISHLPTEDLLLFVCDFDYEKAYTLYTTVPVGAVEQMVKNRVELEQQRIGAFFESVIVGFGGKLKGGASDATLIDVSNPENKQAAMSALKKFKLL